MKNETDVFKTVSEPNRVRILMMLLKRPMCVCEITDILQLSTATVSSHLSMLRDKGFVLDEKRGKWIYYRINEHIEQPIAKDILNNLTKWFADNNTVKSDLAKVDAINKMNINCS